MKGVLILTEGRSGSNWLASLSNSTGKLGIAGEWFSRASIGKQRPSDGDMLIQQVLEKSSTPNKFFAVKLFPSHIHYINMKYDFDLVQALTSDHDVKIIRLTRTDRLGQAISYAKALQTAGWTVNHEAKQPAEYDFEMISRCYFMIGQSYTFWDSYLNIKSLDSDHFIYEDMLKSPMPYLQSIADHGNTSVQDVPPSKHSIQRDITTEKWRERFIDDLQARNIVDPSAICRPPKRQVSNVMRYLVGKPMKPYPYMF